MPLHNCLWSHLVRLTGVEIHLVRVGAGPRSNSMNRHLILAAPRLARLCSVRDEGPRSSSRNPVSVSDVAVRSDLVIKFPGRR
jgi:hypothetical protein